jgi:hypothetical protein
VVVYTLDKSLVLYCQLGYGVPLNHSARLELLMPLSSILDPNTRCSIPSIPVAPAAPQK